MSEKIVGSGAPSVATASRSSDGSPEPPPERQRLPQHVVFTATEGLALDVLAALLGRGRGDLVTAPVRFDKPRPELLAAGSKRIALAVARYLTLEEGYKDRQLLRGAARTHGRVWDAHLGEGFVPRYTAASRSLWLASAQYLPALATVEPSAADATRKGSRSLRDVVETDGTASGDWVFYAIAHGAVRTFRLPANEEAALQRRLRVGSPLAMLLQPDPASSPDELRGLFTRLASKENARVAECVETRLARAWAAYARGVWASRLAPDELTRRWTALGRTTRAWLDAVDRAGRMDLARPLLRFVAELVTGPFAEGGEAVRQSLASASGLRNLQERDALLAAAASVVDVGARLLRRREELAGERYGDERYEEAQVYVRDADAILAPERRRVEGVGRALAGVLG